MITYHVFLHIDPTEGEPVGPHTMFRIGEVSKAITSATIMTMFERGEFTQFRTALLFPSIPFHSIPFWERKRPVSGQSGF